MKEQRLRFWLDFVMAMTEKEIKARYKNAVLGFLWIFINPLLQMIVMGFVFQFFIPVKVENYFEFLFTGLLPWNFFAMSVQKCTPAIVYERSLIQKAKFPRESIILSIIFSNLFHFAIALTMLMVWLVVKNTYLNGFSLPELISILPLKVSELALALVWITALTSGLSLLFAAGNVFFRDVNFVVQAAMPLWFYATPVVFTLNLLPAWLRPLFYLNPMTGVVELFQTAFLNNVITNPSLMAVSFGLTVVVVVVGVLTFYKTNAYFDDWV